MSSNAFNRANRCQIHTIWRKRLMIKIMCVYVNGFVSIVSRIHGDVSKNKLREDMAFLGYCLPRFICFESVPFSGVYYRE